MSFRKELLLVLPLLCILVVLPFWKLATGQGIVITNDVGVSDIANLQYPLRYFAGQELRQGRLPLWTPGVYMGYPLQAEGQAGVFSPVNWLLWGLLPVPRALNIGSLLPFVIAAIGTYLLARQLGANAMAAFTAAFGYALSGYFVAHVKHIPIVATACWIPVVLWLVERGIQHSTTAFLGAGLVMGIQWLSGSPQLAYYTTGVTTLYFMGRAWQLREERSLRQNVSVFALALVLSFGLAAVQLLPTFQLVGFSERAGGVSYEFASQFSYALDNLKTFLYPLANGSPGTGDLRVSSIFWEDYAYVGLVLLFVGIIGGLALLRQPGPARLLFTLMVGAFLIVLGPSTPVFRIAYAIIPGLGFFRFPQRLLAFVLLFLVLLAALALTRVQSWLEAQSRRRRSKIKHGRTYSRVIAIGVFILVALDLYFYHIPWNAIVDADVWLTPPETAQVIKERAGDELYRVFSFDVYNTFRAAYREAKGWRGDLAPYIAQREFLQPSLNLIYGVPAADGYVNLVPDCLTAVWGTEKQLGLMDSGLVDANGTLLAEPGFTKLLSLYNVRFLITSQPVQDAALELVGTYAANAHLYENRDVMPRAFAVPSNIYVDGIDAALDLMRSDSFDPATAVAIQQGSADATPLAARDVPSGAAAGEEWTSTVDVVNYKPNQVVINAELSRPGWLVLSDTYFPGWEATVNGSAMPISQANGCVRAVPLEAGQSEVVFRYRPRPLYIGALISCVSVALLVGVWLVLWRKKPGPDLR
jgi:hypothetical protein